MAVSGINDDWRHEATVGAGSLTDYTDDVRSIEPSIEKEKIQSTVFSNAAHQYERGLEDFSISVTYKYSTAMWDIITAIYDDSTGDVDVQYSPIGTGSGAAQITGNMKIFSISAPAGIGELKEFTVEFGSADGNGVTLSTH